MDSTTHSVKYKENSPLEVISTADGHTIVKYSHGVNNLFFNFSLTNDFKVW